MWKVRQGAGKQAAAVLHHGYSHGGGLATRQVLTSTVTIWGLPGSTLKYRYPGSCDVICVSILSTTVSAGCSCAHITNTRKTQSYYPILAENSKCHKLSLFLPQLHHGCLVDWKEIMFTLVRLENNYAIILFTMGEYCSRWSEGTFSLNLAPKVPRDLVL